MIMGEDYLKLNKEAWNKRTIAHLESSFYDNESFIKGRSSLNPIELELLGNVEGKSILHLQCHFGQDSISLSRLGANVVGVDLSTEAIKAARDLARQSDQNTQFVESDVYELPSKLDRKFDYVYSSYGTIGWLPDMNKWAHIVDHFLKPGGSLILVEFHPVVWMFDYDFDRIDYSYFNDGPISETNEGSYTDGSEELEFTDISWNHSLGEVLSSLINSGLSISYFKEYDYSPYNCFKGMIEKEKGKFTIEKLDHRFPMLYSVKASK